MGNFIADLVAMVITVPLLGWVLIYFITFWLTGEKKKAVQWASDITTFFLILSVYFIGYELWKISLVWLIIVLLAGSAFLFSFLGRSIYGGFHLRKIAKGMWRFDFLLFTVLYLLLILSGLVSRIWNA